jgi:hypothetical protein
MPDDGGRVACPNPAKTSTTAAEVTQGHSDIQDVRLSATARAGRPEPRRRLRKVTCSPPMPGPQYHGRPLYLAIR